jgi:hypothetical protein
MNVNKFFERKGWKDSSVSTEFGRALFVAGVVLGAMAEKHEDVEKRIHALLPFGEVKMHELKRGLSEVPLLSGRYFPPEKAQKFMDVLGAAMDTMITEEIPMEMDVDANFSLSMGFVGGGKLFDEISEREDPNSDEIPDHQ